MHAHTSFQENSGSKAEARYGKHGYCQEIEAAVLVVIVGGCARRVVIRSVEVGGPAKCRRRLDMGRIRHYQGA